MCGGDIEFIKERYSLAYKYFSHNIRTCTATIVTMLEVIQDGLDDDISEMASYATESGFLLDIFDRGLSTCAKFIGDGVTGSTEDVINLKKLTMNFLNNVGMLEETPEQICSSMPDDFDIKDKGYAFKNLYQIIIYEAIRYNMQAPEFEINNKEIYIKSESFFTEMSEMFGIFIEIFETLDIELGYDGDRIYMRLG